LASVLAETAELLQVDDPWQIAPSLAAVQKSAACAPVRELERHNEEVTVRSRRLEALQALSDDKRALHKAERDYKVEKESAKQLAKKVGFMREKQKDYARTISRHEQLLTKVGMPVPRGSSANATTMGGLSHESLVALSEKRSELEEELATLKGKLGGYRSLPPDPALASAKLAEAEAELSELAFTLNEAVSSLHLS